MIDTRVTAALAEIGITRYGAVPVSEMVFSESFRALCATNQCGKYGSSWVCPPGVGPFAELVRQVLRFRHGLVLQTVWPIEDAFDIEGMLAAGAKHNERFRRAAECLKPLLSVDNDVLALSAGACTVCGTCTYPSGQPCRYPEKAVASLEAYGIDVARLIASSGLAYSNGTDTVSYVGLILHGR